MPQMYGDKHDAEIPSGTASPFSFSLSSLLWKEGPLLCPHRHSQAYQFSNTSLLLSYSNRLPREDLRMSDSRCRLSCTSTHLVTWQDLVLRSSGLRDLCPASCRLGSLWSYPQILSVVPKLEFWGLLHMAFDSTATWVKGLPPFLD